MAHTWDYTVLQKQDLPKKAQTFMDLLNIDNDEVRIIQLKANPNGHFIKDFEDECHLGCYCYFGQIYLFNKCQVGTLIHELTHHFLKREIFDVKYNTEKISREFINQFGFKLSNYGHINVYRENWDEVFCEIVAVYGRRGQFKEIRELFENLAA